MSDDLISRQAAIDTLNVGAELLRRVLDGTDVVGAQREKYEWGLGLLEWYISDMKELQSAEPEIIRCKDCKHKPSGSGVNRDILFPDEVCPCQCEDDYWYSWMPKDNWFCGSGERWEE